MRIYCAAPMRGYPLANHPAIQDATARMRALGHEVFSPADQDLSRGNDPADRGTDFCHDPAYLRTALGEDLAWITGQADMVVVLPGWQRSKGAQAEVHAALAVGAPVQELAGFLDGSGEGAVTWATLHPEQEAAAAEGTRVTAKDLGSDDEESRVIRDDYCVIADGSCYVARVERPEPGTHVITVRGVRRAG